MRKFVKNVGKSLEQIDDDVVIIMLIMFLIAVAIIAVASIAMFGAFGAFLVAGMLLAIIVAIISYFWPEE